jgi:hypothetical protein
MVTKEEKAILTRTGAGTPGGELLRYNRRPLAYGHQLRMNPGSTIDRR